jgi:hypothetical protein
MLTPNQVHTRQRAEILTMRPVRIAQALDCRSDAGHAHITLGERIAEPLPDVY